MLIKSNISLSESSQSFFDSLKGELGDEYTLEINTDNNLDDLDWKYWLKRAAKHDNVQAAFYDFKLDESHPLNISLYKSNKSNDEAINLHISKKGKHRALFLDRDGIINEDNGYVYKWDDFKVYPDVVELIQLAKNHQLKVIIVTNQSGIARNYYTIEDLNELHLKMNQWLEENNASVDGIFYCPFHPEGEVSQFKRTSMLRKPFPGMFLMANAQLDIDLENSIMVGDKNSDRINELEMMTFFIQGNYELSDKEATFSNLSELTEHIKSQNIFN
ncbi:MAG: HAD family hydrolase [Oligoflexia bacterium]|nr:HAD family hydrolase [Oligoflexia bacterium]